MNLTYYDKNFIQSGLANKTEQRLSNSKEIMLTTSLMSLAK